MKFRLSPTLLLAAYLFSTISYFIPGASWSPMSRFALTRAVVELHSFEITPFADMTGDRAQVGERFYSDKAPIPSLLAVPAYALFHALASARGKRPTFEALGPPGNRAALVRVNSVSSMGLYVCSVTTAGIAGTLLGVALFSLLRRRLAPRLAMAGAITTLLGTPLFAYSASFFGHTLAAAFLLGALATRRSHLLAGACLALAVGCEYIAAVPAAILATYFVWRAPARERAKQLLLLASGALGPLALVALYHHVCFGAFWRTGYGFVTLPVFAEGHARGVLGVGLPRWDALWGITFGRSRGLFYLAPITLLGVVALALAWKRAKEPELGVCLALVIALFLANAGYYAWDGGLALGPRHLVPMLGFLGMGIGIAFAWTRGRALVIAFAIVSVLAMVLGVAVGLEIPESKDALFDHIYPSVLHGLVARTRGASNFGLLLHLGRSASVIPVLLWIALGAWWLLRPSHFCDGDHDPPNYSGV